MDLLSSQGTAGFAKLRQLFPKILWWLELEQRDTEGATTQFLAPSASQPRVGGDQVQHVGCSEEERVPWWGGAAWGRPPSWLPGDKFRHMEDSAVT